MAAEDDPEVELPRIIAIDIDRLPADGFAIRIIYSASREKHEALLWDTAVFRMERETAAEFAKALLQETDKPPYQPDPKSRT